MKEKYSYSLIYGVFLEMRRRCYDKKNKDYKNYGERGIRIYKEWYNNPLLFCEWAYKNGYKKGLCIDRIDNDGNYTPSNCRFITRKENNRNTRRNHLITYKGKTQCVTAWAEELEINVETFKSRVKRGWSIEKMFTQPVRKIT